jgi:hypothetical protein
MGSVSVAFHQPVADVYAYLSDPDRRPEWQWSLRRVERVDGTGAVGTSWVDVTAIGARPAMEVVEADPGRTWTEIGRWHGVAAELRLDFEQQEGGVTAVRATVLVTARGWRTPASWLLEGLAPYAVRSDLRRAARAIGG